MKTPLVVERFADNGEHSHYDLINQETGETLWSENISTKSTAQNQIEVVKHYKISCHWVSSHHTYDDVKTIEAKSESEAVDTFCRLYPHYTIDNII